MIPADVVLVASKSKNCFIQTSSLDGEKTLKKKLLPKMCDNISDVESVAQKHRITEVGSQARNDRMISEVSWIEVEHPNANLHGFSGILKFKNG